MEQTNSKSDSTSWDKLLSNHRLRESRRGPDMRNDFESDFGRIIFSPAIRRMHDKTQVFPLTADDNIHSRLTHSMEVMAIGHSLGIKVCEDKEFVKKVGKTKTDLFREIPTILKNACLIHDIGNPPFGHFGETVIQNYFKTFFEKESTLNLSDREKEDFTFFDGNAQGFRVVTKLQILNDTFGLNLTATTLAAYLKYPNTDKIDKSKINRKKRGVFQCEKDYLNEIANQCGLYNGNEIIRHPLCFLMEAADSICYLVMDMEDGFNKGWYDFEFLKNKFSRIDEVRDEMAKITIDNIGVGSETTCMVKFRIYLIKFLVDLASENFLKNYDAIVTGSYNCELIKDDKSGLTEALTKFSLNEIFPRREITSLELAGHAVLTGLLDIYLGFVFHKSEHYRRRVVGLISDSIIRVAIEEEKKQICTNRVQDLRDETDRVQGKEGYMILKDRLDAIEETHQDLKDLEAETTSNLEKNELASLRTRKREQENKLHKLIMPTLDDLSDYFKLRVVVDYISGMTDQFALSQYQKLNGQATI